MINVINKKDCCGCGACRISCPQKCIKMVEDLEGFLYPQVNKDLCTDCGYCVKFCPMMTTLRHGKQPKAYASWNRNTSIRIGSSSGGIFSAISLLIFQRGGVVFGAGFDKNLRLHHKSAQNEKELKILRGSKYLQSIVGNTYLEAKEYLKMGRTVFFSGTPCQIAGLYSCIGQENDNLITGDIICHGVPSTKVFLSYKSHLEKKYGAKVKKIDFRCKNYGWKQYAIFVLFENGKQYRSVFYEDPYMLGYLKDIYSRPSCHFCRFARIPRIADISLGDFWGLGTHHPQWDDDKGTSLVLVQTKKGKQVLEEIRNEIVVHKANLNDALRSNPCINRAIPTGENRSAFFNDFQSLPFKKVIKKHKLTQHPWRNAIRIVKGSMRKLSNCRLMPPPSKNQTVDS